MSKVHHLHILDLLEIKSLIKIVKLFNRMRSDNIDVLGIIEGMINIVISQSKSKKPKIQQNSFRNILRKELNIKPFELGDIFSGKIASSISLDMLLTTEIGPLFNLYSFLNEKIETKNLGSFRVYKLEMATKPKTSVKLTLVLTYKGDKK